MNGTAASTRADIVPLVWFTAVLLLLGEAWAYWLAPPDDDLIFMAGEIAVFACAVGISGYRLKARRPELTKHEARAFAFWCVAILLALVIAAALIEALIDGVVPMGDLFSQTDSLAGALALGAIGLLLVLFGAGAHYSVARLILRFVAPTNRIPV